MVGKIFVGTPHHRDMEPEYVVSVFGLVHQLSSKGWDVTYRPVEGGLVHQQRNAIFKDAYEEKVDYLLMVDSDSVFNAEDVFVMLDSGKDVVGALYRQKVPPFLPIVYKMSEEKGDGYFRRLLWKEVPQEMFVCGAIGGGLLLVSNKILRALWKEEEFPETGYPFNLIQRKDGKQLGEDMSFCMRVRKAGFDVWCYPSETMGHVGVLNARNNSAFIINKDAEEGEV